MHPRPLPRFSPRWHTVLPLHAACRAAPSGWRNACGRRPGACSPAGRRLSNHASQSKGSHTHSSAGRRSFFVRNRPLVFSQIQKTNAVCIFLHISTSFRKSAVLPHVISLVSACFRMLSTCFSFDYKSTPSFCSSLRIYAEKL